MARPNATALKFVRNAADATLRQVNAKLKVRVPPDDDVVSITFSSDRRFAYVPAEGSLRGTDALVVYRAVS